MINVLRLLCTVKQKYVCPVKGVEDFGARLPMEIYSFKQERSALSSGLSSFFRFHLYSHLELEKTIVDATYNHLPTPIRKVVVCPAQVFVVVFPACLSLDRTHDGQTLSVGSPSEERGVRSFCYKGTLTGNLPIETTW